jgi:hypothetical protein
MPTLLNLVPNSAKIMATSGVAAIRIILRVHPHGSLRYTPGTHSWFSPSHPGGTLSGFSLRGYTRCKPGIPPGLTPGVHHQGSVCLTLGVHTRGVMVHKSHNSVLTSVFKSRYGAFGLLSLFNQFIVTHCIFRTVTVTAL